MEERDVLTAVIQGHAESADEVNLDVVARRADLVIIIMYKSCPVGCLLLSAQADKRVDF